jgi:hypothetical protein
MKDFVYASRHLDDDAKLPVGLGTDVGFRRDQCVCHFFSPSLA